MTSTEDKFLQPVCWVATIKGARLNDVRDTFGIKKGVLDKAKDTVLKRQDI